MADDAISLLSYGIVNTNGRELLLRGIDAIARRRIRPASTTRSWCWTTPRTTAPRSAVRALGEPAVRLIERHAPPRQGRERLAAAAGGPRRVRTASERGRRAAGGGAAARSWTPSTPIPPRGAAAAPAARPRWHAAALRLAPSGRRHRAGPGGCSSTACCRAEPRRRTRRVGWAQSSAMLVRRSAAERGRLARPGLLRLLGRDRLLQAPRATRAAQTLLRARRAGRPPRAAVDGPPRLRAAGSSSSTATATSTCASTTAVRRRLRCGC